MEFEERISLSSLCRLTGLSRQTLWRRSKMGAHGFPQARKDGGIIFYNAAEVAEYLRNGCTLSGDTTAHDTSETTESCNAR